MRHLALCMTLAAALLICCGTPLLAAQPSEITWYGHSAFKVTTPSGKVLLIDPWLANPANPRGKELAATMDKVDLILVTHAHNDHIGNTVEIARRTGARLVASNDLMKAMVRYGGFPAPQAEISGTGNFGGTLALLDGEVRITFVKAVHSSALEYDEGNGTKGLAYAGEPGGFLIAVKGGPTIYHSGDTDLFSDMRLIGELLPIDIMLVCIGDKFTMGPERAAAAVELIRPRMAVPMHYGTFGALTGTPEAFAKALARRKSKATFRQLRINEPLVWK